MNAKINVMLVEDHPDYREILAYALEKNESFELTGRFGTAERALRSVQDPRGRSAPDVILLDLSLPGMSGLDALPWFRKYLPGTKIIVLTQSEAAADVLSAIRHGASGYLLKSSSMKEILQGIHAVMQGGASLDASVARFILSTLQQQLPPAPSAEEPELSGRELEILQMIADGLAKKEIAAALSISTSTVVTYVNRIYTKLNAANAPQAVNKAHKLGLFKPE